MVSAAEENQRYQALGPGQGTVMANQPRLARIEVAWKIQIGLTRGRDHVPDAGTDAVQDSWPNQPASIASSRETIDICPPSTACHVCRTSAAAPSSAWTWRARASPASTNSGGQLRLVSQVDSLLGAEVDHTVVANDRQ